MLGLVLACTTFCLSDGYTFAGNKKLIETSLAPVAASLPRGAAWLVAGYPATARCKAR